MFFYCFRKVKTAAPHHDWAGNRSLRTATLSFHNPPETTPFMNPITRIAARYFALSCIALGTACASEVKLVTIYPEAYTEGLRNPLKGFRPNFWDYLNEKEKGIHDPYAALVRAYVRWNDLEQSVEDDLVANIKSYEKRRWSRFKGTGVKIIPRVYLDWGKEPGDEVWPADMTTGDYSSPQFVERVERLIEALGQCWDDNPRVAWIQMGIIGTWGEHHTPHPTPQMQKLLGEAFAKAFKNKHVLVRHPDEFSDFEVGIYWDSWAHERQTPQLMHGAGIAALNERTGRWKTRTIEGETAYDWGTFRIQPGDDPNDTLRDPIHRDFLIDTIRDLHGTALGWISSYDKNDPEVTAGANLVQQAFGYRFVIDSFSFSPQVKEGELLKIQFAVRNTGSAPFYANWPVHLSLLDRENLLTVWSQPMAGVATNSWMPGEDWDETTDAYRVPPETHTVAQELLLPEHATLPAGEYILALSIPDPDLGELGVRFAIKNHLKGGLHPMGLIAYGVDKGESHQVDPGLFIDPMH